MQGHQCDLGAMGSILPQTGIRTDYRDFVESLFLNEAFTRGLLAIRGANWTTTVKICSIEAEVLASARYDFNGSDELLVAVDGGIAHIIQRERAITVRVAASDDVAGERIEERLRALMPAGSDDDDGGAVEVRIWWSQPQGGNLQVARTLDAPRWDAVRDNYTASARSALDTLAGLTAPAAGGRLLLFHGAPGTGKTHAALSLAAAWRGWLDTEVIADPEQLFGSPKYLLDVITRGREARSKRDRWQLLIVEDAGEFLTPYAKAENGQALSRLLNLTDGILGRGARTLLLLTTNEHVDELHPAIARPGRCLATVAFGPLTRTEILTWCERQIVEDPGRASMTLAELYALREGRSCRSTTERRFGFAA